MADVYSFTTTYTDNYLTRVVNEAPKDSNFIAVHEVLTVSVDGDERFGNLLVLVKESFLNAVAEKYPNHVFLKHELGELLLTSVNGVQEVPGYYTFEKHGVPVSEQYEAEVFIWNEINRMKNLASDRIVKVTIATL